MDYIYANSFEFIDLSDVEENEKLWIQNFLASWNSEVQGPWNKGPHNARPGHKLTEIPKTSHQPNHNVPPPNVVLTTNVNNCHPLPQPIYQPPYPYPQYGVQPDYYHHIQSTPPPLPAYTHPVVYSTVSYQPQTPGDGMLTYSPQPPALNPNIVSTVVDINYAIDNNNTKTCINTKLEISQPYRLPPPSATNESLPTLNNEESVYINGHVENNQNVENIPIENVPLENNTTEIKHIESDETEDATNNNNNSKEPSPKPVEKSWASLFNKRKNLPNITVNQEMAKPIASVSPFVNNANENQETLDEKKNELAHLDDPNYYRMGEFLLEHVVNNHVTSLQPRGLINRSNYCYINSILQALLACPPVYNLLSGLASNVSTASDKKKWTPIIDSMSQFVKEFRHLPATQRVGRRSDRNQRKEQLVSITCEPPFEPFWIYKMLSGKRSDSFVVEGRQEDAEEFLGCLLNGLNDEMIELLKLAGKPSVMTIRQESVPEQQEDKEWQVMGPKNKGCVTRRTEIVKTPISEIFGGHLRSRIHRAGDLSTDNIQPFFALQLNIETVSSVREALEALVCKNQLEGVTSSKTNEEVEAWQQVTIEELPIVLVLHLKCFNFKPNGCTKIIKSIEFPIDLKVDSKLLSSKTNYSPKEKQYKLFAVVYHDGKEVSKGHYITDAYHVGYASWLRFDDASVKPVQEEQVLKPNGTRVPYLLFYRRSDSVRNK